MGTLSSPTQPECYLPLSCLLLLTTFSCLILNSRKGPQCQTVGQRQLCSPCLAGTHPALPLPHILQPAPPFELHPSRLKGARSLWRSGGRYAAAGAGSCAPTARPGKVAWLCRGLHGAMCSVEENKGVDKY